MKCKETKDQVAQLKTTLDPEEKSKMIQTIRLRICGEPSDRSVCCDVDQSKNLEYGNTGCRVVKWGYKIRDFHLRINIPVSIVFNGIRKGTKFS